MADPVTNGLPVPPVILGSNDSFITLLEGQSDIRREEADGVAELRRDITKDHSDLTNSIKTSNWASSDRAGTEADRIIANETSQFIAQQDVTYRIATALADSKAHDDAMHSQSQADTRIMAFSMNTEAMLAGARIASANALGQAVTGQTIKGSGSATRALFEEIKDETLNRELIERAQYVAESREYGRDWRHSSEIAQGIALTTQVNALGSQLSETRQKIVNFGTQTDVAQTSSNNNVR